MPATRWSERADAGGAFESRGGVKPTNTESSIPRDPAGTVAGARGRGSGSSANARRTRRPRSRERTPGRTRAWPRTRRVGGRRPRRAAAPPRPHLRARRDLSRRRGDRRDLHWFAGAAGRRRPYAVRRRGPGPLSLRALAGRTSGTRRAHLRLPADRDPGRPRQRYRPPGGRRLHRDRGLRALRCAARDPGLADARDRGRRPRRQPDRPGDPPTAVATRT